MQKSIRKPKNWQDLETLSKRLWSEELGGSFKKNGRNGQGQNGVDISGIPNGKSNYWGIQCKLKTKDEIISIEEIEGEIKMAEEFKPALEHLIVSTTSSKDVKVEGFVRTINLERQKEGKFGVELYCWEDIEDLLSDNYQTYQWYMQNLDVSKRHAVSVLFNDETDVTTIRPKLSSKIKKYVYQPPPKENPFMPEEYKRAIEQIASTMGNVDFPRMYLDPIFGGVQKVNHAWCDFDVFLEKVSEE